MPGTKATLTLVIIIIMNTNKLSKYFRNTEDKIVAHIYEGWKNAYI